MPRYATTIIYKQTGEVKTGGGSSKEETVYFTALNVRRARKRHQKELKKFEEQQGHYYPPVNVYSGGLHRIGKHGDFIQKLAE